MKKKIIEIEDFLNLGSELPLQEHTKKEKQNKLDIDRVIPTKSGKEKKNLKRIEIDKRSDDELSEDECCDRLDEL